MSEKVKDVPDLEFPWPPCSVCHDGGDMDYDGDTWWCCSCGCRWNKTGYNGRREAP